MKENSNILVAIHCLVYNHEPYLRECLEGFVMQKTNFRFVAVVHEDVSTDKSADIIREYAEKYPDIIKPIFETENQWSKHDGSLDRIMNDAIAATGAKYIAFCEGDDYWTDPHKLQKQVDYMESHPECSLCFHGVKILDETTHKLEPDFLEDVPYSDSGVKLARGNYIHTVSVLIRSNIGVLDFFQKLGRLSMGDQIIYHICAQSGTMVKIPDIMAVYRIGSGLWSNSNDAYRYLMSVISLSKTIPLLTNDEVRQALDETIYKYADVVLNIVAEKDKEIEKYHRSFSYRIKNKLKRIAKKVKKYLRKIFGRKDTNRPTSY